MATRAGRLKVGGADEVKGHVEGRMAGEAVGGEQPDAILEGALLRLAVNGGLAVGGGGRGAGGKVGEMDG